MKLNYFKQYSLLPIILVIAIYAICYFICDIIPVDAPTSPPPFFEYANNTIFPFSEFLSNKYEAPFWVDILLVITIPGVIIYMFSCIITGILLALNIFKQNIAVSIKIIWNVIVAYFAWTILAHIIDWPFWTLISCILWGLGLLSTINEDFESLPKNVRTNIGFLYNYTLPAFLLFVAIYSLLGYDNSIYSLKNSDFSNFPLFEFVNSYIFPYSTSIVSGTDYSWFGKLWRILIFAFTFAAIFQNFFLGIFLYINKWSNKTSSIIAGCCSIIFLYMMWLSFAYIFEWPIFSAIIIGWFGTVFPFTFADDVSLDRCSYCSNTGTISVYKTDYGKTQLTLTPGFDVYERTSYIKLDEITPYIEHFICSSCKSEWTRNGKKERHEREDFDTLEGVRNCKWLTEYRIIQKDGSLLTPKSIKIPKPKKRPVTHNESESDSGTCKYLSGSFCHHPKSYMGEAYHCNGDRTSHNCPRYTKY